MINVCPFCQGEKSSLVMETVDYRFNSPGVFRFVKCQQCDFIYLQNPPSEVELRNLYLKNYQPMRQEIIKNKDFSFLRKIWWSINKENFTDINNEPKGKVLDLGFGQATTLLYLKQKGFDVYGVELNPNLVETAKSLQIKAFVGPLEKVAFPSNYFDLIILSQVLEHIPEPKNLLKEIFRILTPDGKVFVYVPNGNSYLRYLFKEYWQGWYAPFHFYVFTEKSLKQLADECKLAVQQIKEFTPTNFFITSLKAFIWGREKSVKISEKGALLETLVFKLPMAILLRAVDFIFKRGDCLRVVLVKNEEG